MIITEIEVTARPPLGDIMAAEPGPTVSLTLRATVLVGEDTDAAYELQRRADTLVGKYHADMKDRLADAREQAAKVHQLSKIVAQRAELDKQILKIASTMNSPSVFVPENSNGTAKGAPATDSVLRTKSHTSHGSHTSHSSDISEKSEGSPSIGSNGSIGSTGPIAPSPASDFPPDSVAPTPGPLPGNIGGFAGETAAVAHTV